MSLMNEDFDDIDKIKSFLSSIRRDRWDTGFDDINFEFYVAPFTYRIYSSSNKITDAEYLDVLLLNSNNETVFILHDQLFWACEAVQELIKSFTTKGINMISSPSPSYPTTMPLNTLCEIIKYVNKIKNIMVFT